MLEQPNKLGSRVKACALWIGATAVIGIICALFVRHGCLHPGPPVSTPEPSTARAGFCSALNGGTPWLLLVAVPCTAAGAIAFLGWPHPRTTAAGVLVVWLLLVTVAGLANSLSYSVTI